MYANNEHWGAILKIKVEKLCKYYSGNFNKVKCNYPRIKKEILVVKRGFKMLLIFFASKCVLIQTSCKGFCQKELSNM